MTQPTQLELQDNNRLELPGQKITAHNSSNKTKLMMMIFIHEHKLTK